MINLDRLRIFQAVAETRSFTRAAEVVHLTQPGISKHIRQMEEYYGTLLFDRLGKKVALTHAGEILAEATQEIMASVTAAEQRIEELKGLRGGRLVIGASFALGIYLLPGVLAAFRKRYPAVEVTVDISLSAKIMAKILANKLDLGLVNQDTHDPRLHARQFMTDDLFVIIPRHHRWAKKKRIRPQELLGETFIVAARGAGVRAVIEERLKEKGIVLTNVVDFGNVEGVKRAVEAGLGVSIQPQSVVQRELSAGSLTGVLLAGLDAKLGRFYICRKDKNLSNAAKAFLALLQTPGTETGVTAQ
jgi:LysR family transcriptional regulator, low CO2-responsive transcriptional regulator